MNARLLGILALLGILMIGWIGAFVIWRAAEIGEAIGPLESAEFPRLTAVTVGTSGPYENPERMGPTTAIGWERHVVLVDVGRGVTEGLRKSRIPINQAGLILLTNVLPYNTMGLDDLLYTGWIQDRTTPLRVVGPSGTAAVVEGIRAAHARGEGGLGAALGLDAANARIEVLEVGDGWSEEVAGVLIRAGAIPDGPVPALAWRFERGKSSIVVSATGWNPDALVAFTKGADMLVHEGVYIPHPDELEEAGVVADPVRLGLERAIHTPLQEVGRLAERAGVSSLLLVRLRPPPFFDIQITGLVGKSFSGRVLIGEDGEQYRP